MADAALRIGQVVRAGDGFVGAVVGPSGSEQPFEVVQARGALLTVYAVYRAATGEVRRYTRESLKPLTAD